MGAGGRRFKSGIPDHDYESCSKSDFHSRAPAVAGRFEPAQSAEGGPVLGAKTHRVSSTLDHADYRVFRASLINPSKKGPAFHKTWFNMGQFKCMGHAITVTRQQDRDDAWVFRVDLEDEDERAQYTVTVDASYWRKLTGEHITPEALVHYSFDFLLQREAKESILPEFDLSVINHYFPEYERKVYARWNT